MARLRPAGRGSKLGLGLSLTDAQKATKIRARYLEALEREHFDLLPGAAYARGFLRSYAYLLGLDPDPLLDELAPLLAELEPPLPPPAPRRRLPVRALTLVIAGAVVALFAGLAVLGLSSGGGPPLSPLPAAPSPKAARANATSPASAAASPRRRAPSLVLTAARGDCWLSVRRGSSLGALVWEGLLRRGSSLRLARLPLWVRMGAPWNLEARLGAKPLAGLPTAPRPANLLVTRAGATPA
jgi:hypothetical protein